MASLFENLMHHAEIVDELVFEWLGMEDVVRWDSAIVHENQREAWRQALTQARYPVPFNCTPEIWWRYHKEILAFVMSREMYHTEGCWRMNSTIWKVLSSNTDYDSLLANIRGLRFENFQSNFQWTGLSKCAQLESLVLCNMLSDLVVDKDKDKEVLTELFPQLMNLTIQNTIVNDQFLTLFANAHRLTSFHSIHGRGYQITNPAAVTSFMRSIETFAILGDCDAVIKSFFKEARGVQHMSFDNLHKAGTGSLDLETCLSQCPDLRTLTLSRMRVHIPSLFQYLTKYNTRLESLHLNHVMFQENGHECPQESLSLSFHQLHISTPLPGTREQLLETLEWCRPNVSQLTLSFCSKLSSADYGIIANTMYLSSLEINERKELLSGESPVHDVSLSGIVNACSNDSLSLTVVSWPEWRMYKEMTETLKHERTVVHSSR